MLSIIIPAYEEEDWDSEKEEFVYRKLGHDYELKLEHSLLSLHKWEQRWHKPFLSTTEKTEEEAMDYIRCMVVNQKVPEEVYHRLSEQNMAQIQEYIKNPMTAVPSEKEKGRGRRRIITAENIYSWMISLNIPPEYAKWHLESLLTLIRVCEKDNAPPEKRKKHSQKELINKYAAINAANRKKYNSKG